VDLHMMCSPPSGSPADRVGPPRLGVPDSHRVCPFSTSEARRRGQYPPRPGSVYITRSADPGPVNRLFRLNPDNVLLTAEALDVGACSPSECGGVR
jgi:hypothetical protein